MIICWARCVYLNEKLTLHSLCATANLELCLLYSIYIEAKVQTFKSCGFPLSAGCEKKPLTIFERLSVPGNSVGEGWTFPASIFLIPKHITPWYPLTLSPGCIILKKGQKGDILAIRPPGILGELFKIVFFSQILYVYLYTTSAKTQITCQP